MVQSIIFTTKRAVRSYDEGQSSRNNGLLRYRRDVNLRVTKLQWNFVSPHHLRYPHVTSYNIYSAQLQE